VAFADEQQATSSLQTQPASDATKASSSGRKNAHQVAAEHQQEVAILQELLKKQGLSTLPLRLNSGDAELIRYCLLHANVASMSETLAVYSVSTEQGLVCFQICHCCWSFSRHFRTGKVRSRKRLLPLMDVV